MRTESRERVVRIVDKRVIEKPEASERKIKTWEGDQREGRERDGRGR